tara:strand:+ start:3406 stop:4953 length:1548 start_codon:yes stop_codon:yes gene_type:complete
MNKKNYIAVLDFGSQYTQLIARRIREHNVYSEILSYKTSAKNLIKKDVVGIILSGGPSSVYDKKSINIDPKIFDLNIPILGICYGMHLIIKYFGGEVKSKNRGEYGFSNVKKEVNNVLFKEIDDNTKVWMSHGDEIVSLSSSIRIIAKSSNGIIAGIQHKEKKYFGLQFHPEVQHTVQGKIFLSNFLFNISECLPIWTASNFISESIKLIRNSVKENESVITGVSGGVDSSIVATLLHKAIGNRSKCIFIDHGLLRKNEAQDVMSFLKKGLKINIKKYDYSKIFIQRLKGITDPEVKRKIIGEQFIRSFEEVSDKYNKTKYLAQGTLYPDVIESGGTNEGPAVTIKSHHNVGGLPERMNFKLLEPIRMLFKDEVREVGRKLGLPEYIIGRHPFPGPGLAVRILGEVNNKRIKMLSEADQIYIDILKETGEYDKIWQAFAVLIPTKTVGVMGDNRTYENLIGLRAVTSSDGMTAESYRLPYDILNLCANKIVNEVKGINRVVYDVTSKPPSTIEWE